MTVQEVQQAIIEEFRQLDEEGMDKYEYLIELSRELAPLDDQYKNDQYIIQGCQSKVWLFATYNDGKVSYQADSNTALTKGIISLLIKILSNRTTDEIINAELNFVDEIGLTNFLSAQRSNGLLAMLKQMKLYALAFKSRNGE